ncbi:MAG TPA: hypothetical protein VFK79_04415 [Xanthobacteraceae bacterium]|nr:hypothetical protein [Xanthobacteraceae bacterium]
MPAYLTLRNAAVAASMGILAALSFSGVAQAITDTVFRYSSPRAGYYTIDQMAMSPDRSTATYVNSWGAGLAGNACFNTGVNLPHGATITAVAFWYSSAGSGNPRGMVLRHRLSDSTQHLVAIQTFADDSNTRKGGAIPVTAALALINNALYTYSFATCLNSGDNFFSARITYTYATAGD